MADRQRLRATPWPPGEPGQTFRDDRIVWLAARPELERIGRPWWLALLTGGGGGGGGGVAGGRRASSQGSRAKKEVASDRMRRIATTCHDLVPRLTAYELDRVRKTGEVPEWFYLAVAASWKPRRKTAR